MAILRRTFDAADAILARAMLVRAQSKHPVEGVIVAADTFAKLVTMKAVGGGGECNRPDGDWMNVHRRHFDRFRGARRPAEDVIGSPTVTSSGPLLSTSSSSPQVPIRGTDGHFGTVDEVVGTALFLASDGAAFITGHTLAIDCGT